MLDFPFLFFLFFFPPQGGGMVIEIEITFFMHDDFSVSNVHNKYLFSMRQQFIFAFPEIIVWFGLLTIIGVQDLQFILSNVPYTVFIFVSCMVIFSSSR